MAFWNRKKKNDLANEFREYYQPAGNERTGLAWVLALITLICSVFLIVSLFWGGRWVYRKINDRNKDNSSNQPVSRPTLTPSSVVTPAPGATATPTPAATTPTPTATAPTGSVQGATATPTPKPTGLPNTGPDIDL